MNVSWNEKSLFCSDCMEMTSADWGVFCPLMELKWLQGSAVESYQKLRRGANIHKHWRSVDSSAFSTNITHNSTKYRAAETKGGETVKETHLNNKANKDPSYLCLMKSFFPTLQEMISLESPVKLSSVCLQCQQHIWQSGKQHVASASSAHPDSQGLMT